MRLIKKKKSGKSDRTTYQYISVGGGMVELRQQLNDLAHRGQPVVEVKEVPLAGLSAERLNVD